MKHFGINIVDYDITSRTTISHPNKDANGFLDDMRKAYNIVLHNMLNNGISDVEFFNLQYTITRGCISYLCENMGYSQLDFEYSITLQEIYDTPKENEICDSNSIAIINDMSELHSRTAHRLSDIPIFKDMESKISYALLHGVNIAD